MARSSTPGTGGPSQAAALRLARLAPLTPQGVPLSRRHSAAPGSRLVFPAAHPSVPVPLVRRR